MEKVKIANLAVSKLILGGNPFSGFSHQTPEKDQEMRRYYTSARIKATLRQAEALGVNTFIGRTDHHIQRVLLEYWDEGGTIRWVAQTCTEYQSIQRSIAEAVEAGAGACYIHGGQMDHLFANRKLDTVTDAIAQIRDAGLVAGVAAHNPQVHEWVGEHLELDFYMCSYYDPSPRDDLAEQRAGIKECFRDADRAKMVAVIQHLPAPAIHYKVLAAGRHDPDAAFAFVARHLRPQDAVCVGIYPKNKSTMLEENVTLLEQHLGER